MVDPIFDSLNHWDIMSCSIDWDIVVPYHWDADSIDLCEHSLINAFILVETIPIRVR